MEQNKEKKINKKSLIPLIACLVVVAACALCTIGVLISRNLGSDKTAAENDEIVIEQNKAGEMLARNEATLRKLLLEDATYTIAITEDIYVSEPLEVNGTKTLVGDKSIIMDLNTEAKQRVLSVSADAHLILDGATIDGNGVSSGIAVKADGILECLSGNIVYPMPYGIVTEGKVTVEDITIDRSMHTGIYVETGGELYMTGGQIKNCITTGIATSKNAYAKVSEDAVVTQSASSLFYNFGTLDITGGTFSESNSNCIFNKGELNIVSESDKLVEFFNSGRSIISSVSGTTVKIDGLYAHDMAAHALTLSKDSVADVKNVLVENSGMSSFYSNCSKLTLKDVELKDIKSVGINIVNRSTAELNDVTIVNGGHRGIINDSSTVTMKDIIVDNVVGAGIITVGEKSDTTIENTKIFKVGKSGIGITGGTVTAKDIEITDAAGTAIYTTTEKSKTTIDGAKLVNSGKSAIGVSIGTVTAQNVGINGTKNTGVYIQKDAKLTLTDATIKGVNKHGIANYFGTAVVKNVSVEAPTNAGILNQGTLTGEKVTINKSGSRAMSLTDASTTNVKGLVINESKTQSVYIDKVTQAHISDFIIDKSGQSTFRITKSTDVLLKSGTITNANGDGIWVSENAKMKVQDTVIKAPVKYGVEIYANEKMPAEVTAVNVTVNNARAGFVNNGGTLNGENLTVKDSISRSLNLINKGTTSITGLTVKNAGAQGVYIEDTAKVALKEIHIDTTKSAAIRAAKATNVSIKTGTIKNVGSDGVYVCDEAAIKVEAVDISDAVGYGLMAYGAELTAIDVDVTKAKAGLVNNGGTVNGNTISIDTTTSRALSLISGSTTKIAGLTVKNVGNQGVYAENSTVNLSNFTVDTTKSAAFCLGKTEEIDETAVENVTLTDGTIKNSGSTGIYVGKTAVAKVTDVTIENSGQHGIQNASGKLTGKTLTINQSTNRAVTMATDSETTIDGLDITGTGDQAVYVDGGKESKTEIKGFEISDSGSAAVRIMGTKNVELTGGLVNASTYGIAISGDASAVAEDVRILRQEGNKEQLVWVMPGATLTMQNGKNTVAENQSLVDGQGLDGQGVVVEGTFNLNGGTITGHGTSENPSTKSAAGVYVKEDATFFMNGENAVVEKNYSEQYGAGVVVADNATFEMTAGKIQYNESAGEGAGVYVADKATFTMSGDKSYIQHNATASGVNGGGSVVYGTFNLNGGEIYKNVANKGAGVFVRGTGTLAMTGGKIWKNEAVAQGGGIFTMSANTDVSGGAITENKATDGAGIYLHENNGRISLAKEATVNNNIATGNGGGLYVGSKQGDSLEDNVIKGEIALNEAANGGGIYVNGNLKDTWSDLNIHDNKAAGNGGGLYIYSSADFKVSGNIKKNTATNGGGIYTYNKGQLTVTAGSIAENVATKNGSGVYVGAGDYEGAKANAKPFTLSGGSISGHGTEAKRSTIEGNAVYVANKATFKLDGTGDISSNHSNKQGNAVYVLAGGTFEMNGGTIKDNNTTNTGSVSVYGSFKMNGGDIKENHASMNAGGVIIRNTGSFSMTAGTVDGNTTNGNGGGIYIQSNSNDTSISGGTIQNNEAKNGGGIYVNTSGKTFTLSGSALITANKSTTAGAGVYVDVGTFTMSGGSITKHGTPENPSSAVGAGVYVNSKLSMSGGTISDNHSIANGAGVATYATFNMSGSSTIQNNTTTGEGGAVYVGGGAYTLNNGTENTLYKNKANNGGAVAVAGGTFHLKRAYIKENQATTNGGGVYVASGTFKTSEASKKSISNNTAGSLGGGLYLAAGTTCELDGSGLSFDTNSAVRGKDMYLVGQITLKSALTDEIAISPSTYSTDTVIATGTLDDTFKASMKKFAVEKATDNTYWIVNEDGKLMQASIGVGTNGVGYATLADAVAGAADGDTITLLQNQTITEGITVAKNLTLTSAVPVTISTDFSSSADLFTVAEGGALAINGATGEGNGITLAGGTNTNYVINNSGTLLLSNVNITGGKRGIQHTKGTLGTVENPLTNVNVSKASAQGIRIESGTAQIQSAKINDSGNYGLVVKGGTVTVKNTVIDNAGITTTTAARIGIAAHGGTLTLDNVTIQHFRGTDGNKKNNNNHGIELAYSGKLVVTANEPDSKGLHISDVKGHGIYAHDSEKIGMNISKISVDGNNKTVRAGIQMTNCGTLNDTIENADIKECNAPIQLKNASVKIEGKDAQETTGTATNYNTDGTKK